MVSAPPSTAGDPERTKVQCKVVTGLDGGKGVGEFQKAE